MPFASTCSVTGYENGPSGSGPVLLPMPLPFSKMKGLARNRERVRVVAAHLVLLFEGLLLNWGISLLPSTLRILHRYSEESAAWARREQVPLHSLHSCDN